MKTVGRIKKTIYMITTTEKGEGMSNADLVEDDEENTIEWRKPSRIRNSLTKSENGVYILDIESWLNTKLQNRMRSYVVKPDLSASPSCGNHFFWMYGRPVFISRERDKEQHTYRIVETFRIKFLFCMDVARIHNLIKQARIESLPYQGEVIKTVIGDYDYEARKRSISSVVLDKDIKENMINDIKKFLDGREEYDSRGIPWKRGYLLYGPPGNGKTSFVKAIAAEFDLELLVIQLSGVSEDSRLSYLMSSSKPKIILIEDIDRQDINNLSDKNIKCRITNSGLLNAVDGVAPSDGRILFVTTNNIGNIDPALFRSGRLDKKVLFDNASKKQAVDIYRRFFPNPSKKDELAFSKLANGENSMADLQNALLSGWGTTSYIP